MIVLLEVICKSEAPAVQQYNLRNSDDSPPRSVAVVPFHHTLVILLVPAQERPQHLPAMDLRGLILKLLSWGAEEFSSSDLLAGEPPQP